MTFEECFARWWAKKKLSVSPLTVSKYEMIYNVHILPQFRGKELSEISDDDVVKFITEKREHGNRLTNGSLCANTVRKLISAIHGTYEYAIQHHMVESNPCNNIKLKKDPPPKIQVFSESEIEALVQCSTPDWLSDMILLAYHTGMRKGELYGLQWDDVDFQNSTLDVQRSVASDSYGKIYINPTKTQNSDRKVFLDEASIQMLARRYKRRNQEIQWVFTGRNGDLLSPLSHSRLFRKACESADVPPRNFHCIRHSHITWLLNKGVPVKLVSERVGHADASITLKTYAHYIPSTQSIAVDVLNSNLNTQNSIFALNNAEQECILKEKKELTNMANRTRKTTSDKIAILDEKISKAKDAIEKYTAQIQEYENEKQILKDEERQKQIESLSDLLAEKGLSVDDIKKMLTDDK